MNALGNMDLASLFQLLGSLDINQLMAMLQQMRPDPNDPNSQFRPDDPRLGLLYSLKPLLPPENANLIDEVVKMLTSPQGNK